MNSVSNESLETDGIFAGNPSKQELINYFMKQQRLATIKKLEEIDRDSSPELSESFEIYLEQKKKIIEMEKQILNEQNVENHSIPEVDGKIYLNKISLTRKSSDHNLSGNDESFLELEKLCENTLNLNNVSEILADLTSMDDVKNNFDFLDSQKNYSKEETRLFEIEQPSYFLNSSSLLSSNENLPMKIAYDNHPSTIMEETETSLSYKTTQNYCQTLQSITSTDKSEYYQTANDKSFESTIASISLTRKPNINGFLDDYLTDNKDDISFAKSNVIDLSQEEKKDDEYKASRINDTLDEIDFLLAQAEKINENKKSTMKGTPVHINNKVKNNSYISPNKEIASPKSVDKRKLSNTPKHSPLITFSPINTNSSPSNNFKLPKHPTSSSKGSQLSKLNNKKFQHIVSPISRYIQTSESVLNANAHVQYKGTSSKKQFNFRDSENFNKSIDTSIKTPSLPLRAKTTNSRTNQSPIITMHKPQTITKNKLNFFANNTLDESQLNAQNHADLSLLSNEGLLKDFQAKNKLK